MKTKKFLAIMTMAVASFAMVACGDDDENNDEPKTPQYASIYSVNVLATMTTGGAELANETVDLTVTALGDTAFAVSTSFTIAAANATVTISNLKLNNLMKSTTGGIKNETLTANSKRNISVRLMPLNNYPSTKRCCN
jgi:hypothetical protein